MTDSADRLLKLVLDRVAQTWREVHGEATGRLGPGPTAFIVQQCGVVDWQRVQCGDPVLHTWVHDEHGTVDRDPTPEELAGVTARTGMCFVTGRIWFHLDEATNRVAFTYMAGPRFGRGMVLRAEGDRLLLEPVPIWVS